MKRIEPKGHSAEQRVLEDLINALLAEQLLERKQAVRFMKPSDWEAAVKQDAVLLEADRQFADRAKQESMCVWRLSDQGGVIVFPVHAAIVQPIRFNVSQGAFKLRMDDHHKVYTYAVGAVELMGHVAELYADDPVTIDPAGANRLIGMLEQTIEQTGWSFADRQPSGRILDQPAMASLLGAERKAAFRDRPFHPVSKAKQGWNREDCRSYAAESAQPVKLNWMAVRRDHLVGGHLANEEGETGWPADLLLSAEDKRRLDEEMSDKGLDADMYAALPVHPWQMREVLPERLSAEIEEAICVPLNTVTGDFYASSSVRSLMREDGEGDKGCHVKLPIGIYSLGGLRYLSAIKLMNGQSAETLLRQAVERDQVLKRKLYLCDETNWWAYLPASRDLFADYPRHMSAMVRKYPTELTDDADVRLLPMSALAVWGESVTGDNGHLFDEWMRLTGLEPGEQSVARLLRESLTTYYEVCFRLFALGIMPEIHGQNSVLVWRNGSVEGLLLRDHDALRLHVPWLNANGLADPVYKLRPGFPDSLYHHKPEKLFAFFQMLGVQVNSYAIVQCLSEYYGLNEERLWLELYGSLKQAIAEAGLPAEAAAVIEESLFNRPTWPWKQIVRPLVKQVERVPGSMPYGQGEVPNPFHALASAGKYAKQAAAAAE